MHYRSKDRSIVHKEVDWIFKKLLLENGLSVREEQIRLCHEMIDALWDGKIILCDAGVGIGKTYAYLVACIMFRKYKSQGTAYTSWEKNSVVISTSSIALQKALTEEYVPFLSKIFQRAGIIDFPLKAVVRKGKEHFVCDYRLSIRLEAVKDKKKNTIQRQALESLREYFDLDEVHRLSGFDRRLVCVPKFCPRECPGRYSCRYQQYLQEARKGDVFLQICNHNYLLADAMHRENDYRPLLAEYQILIVDEAHKLSDAASQMCGRSVCKEDIDELGYLLSKEHRSTEAKQIRECYEDLEREINQVLEGRDNKGDFHFPIECSEKIHEVTGKLQTILSQLQGKVPRWLLNRLEYINEILSWFACDNPKYILYLKTRKKKGIDFMAASREIPQYLYDMLWKQKKPSILTSATLMAGGNFKRIKQVTGLEMISEVRECVAESPFQYDKNCLLYLPKNSKCMKRGSQQEAEAVAAQVRELTQVTYGHTLVLFTAYTLMGNVYQILKDQLPFSMIEVWQHSQEEITRFKQMENSVLFAAGSCWEGVDFPGDRVSSLIIVNLPFAVPDPIHEAEREKFSTLQDYIQAIVVPDMQKKLRQGFGRAIRTEEDTCVVTILDHRASAGEKYHAEVLSALPECKVADTVKDVEEFILSRKRAEYYLE